MKMLFSDLEAIAEKKNEVLKKYRPKKEIWKKSNMNTRSKILKFIVMCLETHLHSQMLYWDDKEKNEFVIKFVHMNNPKWKTDYLALFEALDELSSKHRKYLLDEKYKHSCKVRCKSNLRKLQKNGAITYMGSINQGKSIKLRKYKLNIDVASVMKEASKGAKMTKRNNINLNGRETVPEIVDSKSNFLTEFQPNEQSHYLCLSNLSSVNSTGHTLLNTCSTAENRNEDPGTTLPQIKPLTVYEHEKQMNRIDVLSESFPTQNFSTRFMTCSGIEEKDSWRSIECDKLFDEKIQESFEIENAQNENFSGETKTLMQLVPCSPSNCKDIKDPSSEWFEDYEYDKLLQQDDPFLSSTMSESNNLLEGNEGNFPLDFKDFKAYENDSSDAGFNKADCYINLACQIHGAMSHQF